MKNSKNNLNSTTLYQITQNTIDKYNINKYAVFYTDAAKKENKIGMGFYMANRNLIYNEKIEANIAIKTAEIYAIYILIKKIQELTNIKNIIIFTDSKSSCKSIKGYIKKKNNKYYKNKIIELIKNYKDINITIQWIPSHINIQGNDLADLAAKEGMESGEINKIFKIPKEDIIRNMQKNIKNWWSKTYTKIKIHKKQNGITM